MRAREWKKAIQDEQQRLLEAAAAEREHGDGQKRMAYEKAKSYEATAESLGRILAADQDNGDDDDDDGVDDSDNPVDPVEAAEGGSTEPVQNDLLTVGEGDKAF